MARINQVADNTYSINPQLNFMFSLAYLILDDKPALIDPGSTAQTEIVLDTLENNLGFDLKSLAYAIPTHLHLDHGAGAGYIAQRLPRTQIVVQQRYKKHLQNPVALIKAFQSTFGEDFADRFGPVLPVPEDRLLGVDDGDRLDLGEKSLQVIVTRGHANHHISVFDSKTQGLFCGDTLGMYYPQVDGIVVVCPEGFDLELQLNSISLLKNLNPQVLFYAHEGTGHNPHELIERTAQQLKDCEQVVRMSMENGDDPLQTENRLEDYFRSNVSPELNYRKMYLGLTVSGYRKYLQKPSMQVVAKGEN